jgi:isoquinoline 1-oxidoreductase alpha subunit
MAFTIRVNGAEHSVDGDTPLLWVLRDVLGLTGTKFGCGTALCGACTVHLNGGSIRSCVTPVESIGDASITTIEAIGATTAGQSIQKAWLDLGVVQCGYCQSGQIMSAAAFKVEEAAGARPEGILKQRAGALSVRAACGSLL